MKRINFKITSTSGFAILMAAAVLCWPAAQVWARTTATVQVSGRVAPVFGMGSTGCEGTDCSLTVAAVSHVNGSMAAGTGAQDTVAIVGNVAASWHIMIAATDNTGSGAHLLAKCAPKSGVATNIGACTGAFAGDSPVEVTNTAALLYGYTAPSESPSVTNGGGDKATVTYTAYEQQVKHPAPADTPAWTVTYILVPTP